MAELTEHQTRGDHIAEQLDNLRERVERLELAERAKTQHCSWWTNGNSWALWTGPPSVRQCALVAGHDGNHI